MRKFMVVLDSSTECLNAMRFAAMRAEKTNARVEVLAIIPPEEFNHWIGVGELMREEARDRINAHFQKRIPTCWDGLVWSQGFQKGIAYLISDFSSY